MIVMRVFLFLILTFILTVNSVFAYDLVLPKEKKSIVNTNYALFVGKAKNTEIVTINDEKVFIAPNGAFAHSIKLKDGENRIVLRSNFNVQIYKIYKTPKGEVYKQDLVEFEPKNFIVKKDNVPLRSTPIDFGMNRMSHLFKGTYLLIDGEKDGFYRVVLTKNRQAWICKKHVEAYDEILDTPNFVNMDTKEFKNASVHTIEFSQNLPYTIDENDKEIVFRVYNPFIADMSVYTINIKKPEKFSYTTNLNDGVYEFKLSHFPVPEDDKLQGITITIDAGHGGSEKGALGCLGDEEKKINLAIADELQKILVEQGANVVMTRECDGTMSLDDRVELAKKNDANIFVSIHLNSIPDIKMDIHKNRGTSVYFYNQNSKKMADALLNSLTKELGTRNDGVRQASFAVIRPTHYVGVLIEVAYMTNPLDSVLYTQESFPQETAKAIADGILDFVSQ